MSESGKPGAQAEDAPEDAAPKARGRGGRRWPWIGRRWHWNPFAWPLFVLFDLVVLLGIGLVVASEHLDGRDVPAPGWVAEEAGRFLSRGLGGGRAEVGQIALNLSRNALPEVVFRDVRLSNPSGAELVAVPSLQVKLGKRALFRGEIRPRVLEVSGASLELRRRRDGSFDLGFGAGNAPVFGSLNEAIAAVRNAFELPGLARLERVEVHDLGVLYDDERAGRTWRVTDGTLLLTKSGEAISLSAALDLPEQESDGGEAANLALRLTLGTTGAGAEASMTVRNVAAEDIAVQSPALTWLEPLRARVSGAVIVGATPDGQMGPLNATLEIGSGVFQPETGARPIPFDGARTYFSYRPEQARITFEELTVRAPNGTVSATGHADLVGIETGWPTALTGQFSFDEVTLDPPGWLPGPAHFDGGVIDVKVARDPFEARIGQWVMTTADPGGGHGATRFDASGTVGADDTGWHVALDIGLDQVEAAPMLALWPLGLAPGARRWIENNMLAGLVHDARAGLRFDQGQRPDVSITFEFRDSVLRPIATLPPITGASGFAALGRDMFSLTLASGQVTPPQGGTIDAAGSSFRIVDVSARPSTGELLLQTASPLTAALSLLDQAPFRFLSKAGQPVSLGEGWARLAGRIAFPLQDRITISDVDFSIAGTVSDLRSDVLVPGRALEADSLALKATPEQLAVSGAGRLDTVPLEATFTLPFGPEAAAPKVEGNIEVGERFVTAFGIGLPDGSVRGEGDGRFEVGLPAGAPPRFALDSDLVGVGLSLPPIGWSKPREARGRLAVSGHFGQRPAVDVLSLSASGLTAEGSVSITPAGGLDEARFTRVAVGGWLDAPVTLTGRGAGGTPAVAVRGGSIDIRKTSLGTGGGSRGGGAGPPIDLALDRLTISEGIALTGFRGELSQSGGLSGSFTGAVNGQAEVRGTLERSGAVRIRSDNAGAVFKSAGIFKQASGGAMDLRLTPRAARGEYDGDLTVDDVRVRSASGLTALINAISVVGLIDELNGAGILFTDVEAAFRLTPTFVQVTRASGVGPSLGISMEGVYDMVNDRLNMQGVISPVYALNAIGQLFTRKGEGLIGFNYKMRGSSQSPSVEVNPLSVLTPGMFREIFRAPPPKPQEEE